MSLSTQTFFGRLLILQSTVLLALVSSFAAGAGELPVDPQQPNIVLVYADDVDCETVFGQFPQQEIASMRFKNLQALALDGIRFSNFHVTTPVCGPSRACLYSGQYAHHNGCRVNNPASVRAIGFDGGFKTFDPENELAIWMKRAGYTTAHVGKYLHSDFNPSKQNGAKWSNLVPPGWDHFRLSLGGWYFNFPCYVKATDTFQNMVVDEYRTDWDVRHAIDVLNQHAESADSNKPLLLCWSPIAAHITDSGQSMVAPRHKSMYTDAQIPGFEDRLSASISGQVKELHALPLPNEQQKESLTKVYRDRLRAMKSIDEGVGALRSELKKLGMEKNTIFIFTSDHGFRFSQHRHYGKRLPYDRISRVPFIVAGPKIPSNVQCDELLCNIDIAPTLVRIAGKGVPESCDGLSFLKLLIDPDHETLNRDAIAIENWGEAVSHDVAIPATYSSLRSRNKIYTEWASGGRELYDLEKDPEQLHNRYEELTEQQQIQWSSDLKKLRKTNHPPFFADSRCEQETNPSRVCASLIPVVFSGLVEADAGMQKVELEFRCVGSGEYWTGSGWSDSVRRHAATLRQPQGINSQWVYSLDTRQFARALASESKSPPSPRKVRLTALATDLSRRQTRQKALDFEMSFSDPDTSIVSHQESDDRKQLTIRGDAFDLHQITAVRVSVLDPASQHYWNGKSLQQEYCHLQAELLKASPSPSKHVSWQLKITKPPSSELVLVARAYGAKTNYDHSPAVRRIELESESVDVLVSTSE